MRKRHKKQCLETLELLREADKEIADKLLAGLKQEALELLAQCQQGAIGLGNFLEGSGNGDEAGGVISQLEAYCELIYRFYSDITAGNLTEPRQIRKKLDKCINRAVSAVNALPTREEIVFLPYKAAMWDSLESVWKKADADENCDAYVIPIPYCDRNPDGTVREVHYEADLLPKGVPITHFEAYDFASRHPDRIYIHNPYDEFNHVTSVDPAFYSGKLKQYTDELVYIPYFILDEPPEAVVKELRDGKPSGEMVTDPETGQEKSLLDAYLESLSNYVLLPGVLNADKVIVQSEEMKDCYVEILTRQFGEETRQEWERRIEGTGSPKVDRVLNTNMEDLEIPDRWERIFTKPDGSRKKIILYNTGLSAMLKENERMLAKIRDVFRIFRENSEDIALLWRPHPLLEATLASMRTELAEEYREIKEGYQEEGFGIYDDSADLDRAIILSDAYYGDMSSVVWLYKKTGKPIMIQNAEILEND